MSKLALADLRTLEVVNLRKNLTTEMENNHRSMSSIYKGIRKENANTKAILEEAIRKGRSVNLDVVHEIINVGNFKLFNMFMISKVKKDKAKTEFNGYDTLSFEPKKAKVNPRFSFSEGYTALLNAAKLSTEQMQELVANEGAEINAYFDAIGAE